MRRMQCLMLLLVTVVGCDRRVVDVTRHDVGIDPAVAHAWRTNMATVDGAMSGKTVDGNAFGEALQSFEVLSPANS